MRMKEIVIIGAGDFGREVTWLIEEINKVEPTYHIAGYLDDDPEKRGKAINGYKVLGKISELSEFHKKNPICAIIAMQDGTIRKRIVEMFPDFKEWETLIHPSVDIADTAKIGCGCVICAKSILSLNTIIGDHCLFNVSVIIGHDGEIGNYVTIMSGSCICGHVKIDDEAYIATNSTIIPKIKIGARAKVGAGSSVIQNIKDGYSVMGVPAKVIRIK